MNAEATAKFYKVEFSLLLKFVNAFPAKSGLFAEVWLNFIENGQFQNTTL